MVELVRTPQRGRWQVFGLVGGRRGRCRAEFLLAVASRDCLAQCWTEERVRASVTAVVTTYRCGAAPDLHRIPSLATPGRCFTGNIARANQRPARIVPPDGGCQPAPARRARTTL
jgi:hypothetical protein